MNFRETALAGAMLVELKPHRDDRGSFARLWCEDTFREAGIKLAPVQVSVSQTLQKGTVRGLHFQWPPSAEAKLVRCSRGRIFDVILDLRPESDTYTRHCTLELCADNQNALYIPPGIAHGFQTLEADCDVTYMMSARYDTDLADGVRYDDSAFGIDWPEPVSCIAYRDRNYPDFDMHAFTHQYQQSAKAGA